MLFPFMLGLSVLLTFVLFICVALKFNFKFQTIAMVAVVVVSWTITVREWQTFKLLLDTQI